MKRGSSRHTILSCIALIALTPAILLSQGVISGTVTESNTGRPLAGARVVIVETRAAATTDRTGRYTLTSGGAERQITLRATMLGYSPRERQVSSSLNAAVDFALERHVLGLDDVVVTGTGGPARVREVGHSVARIDVTSVAEPVVSMDNLLASKVPGVSVMIGSGLSGAGSQIRLRGNTSVALSNQPLVYVDGVRVRSDGYPINAPRSGNQLRAANEAPSPINDIEPEDVERVEIVRGPAATTLYGTEAATGVIQIFTKRGAEGRPVWNSRIEAGFDQVQPFGTDDEPYMRLDPWLKRAKRFGYSMSASGGSDVRYFAAASYDRADGVLPNDEERRIGLRGNFDFNPAPRLSLRWSSSFTQGEVSNTPSGSNLQGLTFNAYRGDTNPTGSPGKESIDRTLAWKIDSDLRHLIGGLTASYADGERSSHTVTVGFDRAETDMRSLRPFGFVFAPTGILSSERWSASTLSGDYLGRAGFALNDKIDATLSWGGQTIGTRVESVAGYAESFAGPGEPTLGSGAISQSFESRSTGRTGGVFGQAVLGISDRLFITAGLRLDGNSAFGSDFGIQPYPRVSASWVVSDHSFWPASIGPTRFRAAYGHAGRAPRSFDAQRTWATGGFDGAPAYTPLSVGNALLGPETTAETEVGFDASLFRERISIDFNYYRRTTQDALFPVTQPASLGFLGAQLENVGSIRATGLEASLTATVLDRDAFTWTLGADVATNRSKVTDLGGAPRFVIGEQGWIIEGEPAPVVRSVIVTNADEFAEPVSETGHVYGPNMPTRTVGLRSALRLRSGIELAARAEYSGGNYILDNASRNLAAAGSWPVCNDAYAAIKDGQRETLTAWYRFWCTPTSVPVEAPVWPASFAKLRSITLTVPLLGKLLASRSAALAISGRNIMLWKNSGMLVFDPEMSGRDGMHSQVRTIEMQVPPAAGLLVSLRGTW